MQRLEVSGAVRLIYRSLGVKGLIMYSTFELGKCIGYGLDGPGIEPRCGRDFAQPPRPALGPTHLPVQ